MPPLRERLQGVRGARRRRSYRYFRPDDLGRQHYVYYRRASLRLLLERHGFRVVASDKAELAGARVARAVLGLWQALGERLHLRRELYFVAELSSAQNA